MCSARRSTVAVVIAISRDLILISTLPLSLLLAPSSTLSLRSNHPTKSFSFCNLKNLNPISLFCLFTIYVCVCVYVCTVSKNDNIKEAL